MDKTRHALPAEQHDAEESRFEHERHRPFESEYRAKETSGETGEFRPVGAEFEFHRQTGNYPNREIEHKKFRPEARVMIIGYVVGLEPQRFEYDKKERQSYRQNWP